MKSLVSFFHTLVLGPVILMLFIFLLWADGDRGPVLRSSGQRHVRRGESEVHGLQGPEELHAARVCPEPLPDHGEASVGLYAL